MEQLDFFEIVKFIFAALLGLSAFICFWEMNLTLFWKRFFRGLFVLLIIVLVIFPLNALSDASGFSTFGGHVVNVVATAVIVVVSMIIYFVMIIAVVCLNLLLKALWEWIKVSD